MSQGILVFIEERQGTVKKPSLEALSAARKLADDLKEQVTAFYIGAGDPSELLASYGADKVVRAQHELLASYSAEGFAAALSDYARNTSPRIVLSSATAMGRDFIPRAAARLRVGLAQDCTEARIVEGQQMECVRPIYAGKAYSTVRLSMTPAFATLRPNVFSLGAAASGRSAAVETFTPALSADRIRARVVEIKASAGQKVVLTEANIVVSGGRGLKGPENFPMI